MQLRYTPFSRTAVITGLTCMGLLFSSASASTGALKDIKSLSVNAAPVTSTTDFSQSSLKTLINERINSAGIPVDDQSSAQLKITIEAAEGSHLKVTLQLTERVPLPNNPSLIREATIWEKESKCLPMDLKRTVESAVDAFSIEYLRDNRNTAPSSSSVSTTNNSDATSPPRLAQIPEIEKSRDVSVPTTSPPRTKLVQATLLEADSTSQKSASIPDSDSENFFPKLASTVEQNWQFEPNGHASEIEITAHLEPNGRMEDLKIKKWSDSPSENFSALRAIYRSSFKLGTASNNHAGIARFLFQIPRGSDVAQATDSENDIYMGDVGRRVKRNWQLNSMTMDPPSTFVVVSFKILKDGNFANPKVLVPSDDSDLDSMSLRAIALASPFKVPPGGKTSEIRFTFTYDAQLSLTERNRHSYATELKPLVRNDDLDIQDEDIQLIEKQIAKLRESPSAVNYLNDLKDLLSLAKSIRAQKNPGKISPRTGNSQFTVLPDGTKIINGSKQSRAWFLFQLARVLVRFGALEDAASSFVTGYALWEQGPKEFTTKFPTLKGWVETITGNP